MTVRTSSIYCTNRNVKPYKQFKIPYRDFLSLAILCEEIESIGVETTGLAFLKSGEEGLWCELCSGDWSYVVEIQNGELVLRANELEVVCGLCSDADTWECAYN